MGLDQEEDAKRRMVELALHSGRKRQSKQTGFVHYCYESSTSDPHDTIPLVENFCFALALFRSRLVESVQEGKRLLEKLLAFEIGGNFPLYLHEYPHCKDIYLSIHLFPALFWIEKDFHSILGEELLVKLQGLIQRIRIYGLRLNKEHVLPKSISAKLSALEPSLAAFDWDPSTPAEWGEFFIASQMLCQETQQFEKALTYWHPHIHAFIGPNAHPLQEQNEPAISLFDLFMSHHLGSFSKRLLQDHPIHLRAALVYPFKEETSILKEKHSSFAFCSAVSKGNACSLVWGDSQHTHSLVCPYKKNQIQIHEKTNAVELFVKLAEQIPDEGEERMEIAFFCDLHSENQVFIDQEKATTFQLGQSVEILSKTIKIRLVFSLIEGEGIFFGHLSRTNRPGQKSCHGERIYEAYDWQIGLRTIARNSHCLIRVVIEVLEKACPS